MITMLMQARREALIEDIGSMRFVFNGERLRIGFRLYTGAIGGRSGDTWQREQKAKVLRVARWAKRNKQRRDAA